MSVLCFPSYENYTLRTYVLYVYIYICRIVYTPSIYNIHLHFTLTIEWSVLGQFASVIYNKNIFSHIFIDALVALRFSSFPIELRNTPKNLLLCCHILIIIISKTPPVYTYTYMQYAYISVNVYYIICILYSCTTCSYI